MDSRLKILILTWEYPPNMVGGLSRHVYGLSVELARQGVEVHVLTTGNKELTSFEKVDGVYVHRVIPVNEQDENFLSWVGGLNVAMALRASDIANEINFDLVHAHDWLVGAAGIAIKETLAVPLLTTIHATEHGRNGGIYNELQRFIHEKERQLIKNSDEMIVCSQFMKTEVMNIFHVHEDKIMIIPNGIQSRDECNDSKEIIPKRGHKKIIFSIGRMVDEKGFGTIIEAASIVKKEGWNLFFVIAGKGPMLENYRSKVRQLELEEVLTFIGYLTDEQKNAYLLQTDITIFPSLYEPFGIVALEAMNAGKPTIVSKTGGLKGIVQHLKSGLLMIPGNANSLLEQINFLIDHPKKAKLIGIRGRRIVKALYGWKRIASETHLLIQDMLLNKKVYGHDYEEEKNEVY